MTARQRLWLSRLFILLFLVITPLILTYAAGYHINWRYLKLERTGLLEIKTEPSGALINIEEIKAWLGKPKELITPIKLKNLRPGSYHINLSLTGYHNWQKTLVIRPAETTFAKNIRLFKQSNPQQLADLPLGSNLTTVDWPTDQSDLNLANKNLTTSTITALLDEKSLADNWLDSRFIRLACQLPDKKIAYTKQFELWLADSDKKTTTLLGRFSQSIDQLICLPNTSNYLIFGHNQGWQLIELDDRQNRSIWKLADVDQLGLSAINKKANTLYFYGQIASTTGLFSLDL